MIQACIGALPAIQASNMAASLSGVVPRASKMAGSFNTQTATLTAVPPSLSTTPPFVPTYSPTVSRRYFSAWSGSGRRPLRKAACQMNPATGIAPPSGITRSITVW